MSHYPIFIESATHHTPRFFFSRRRRHTRSKRAWSSDVCSSDLCRWQIPRNYTAWEKTHVAVIGADLANPQSFHLFRTTYTNTSETTRKPLRNWRRSRQTSRYWVSDGQVARSQPRAIRASSCLAITSSCLGLERMPDAC